MDWRSYWTWAAAERSPYFGPDSRDDDRIGAANGDDDQSDGDRDDAVRLRAAICVWIGDW